MNYLGIRCSNTDYTYVVLKGDSQSPEIVEKKTVAFPAGFSRSESLKWFHQELEGIIKRCKIKVITIKGAEALATRDKSFVARVENEAMIYFTAASLGIENVSRKVKATIAKDLGLKGKGKYLTAQLDTSVFPTFADESDKTKESIWAAWSSMK